MGTIIFLSGFLIPNWLAKTKYLWNKPMWNQYHTIFLESKTPRSDVMVEKELDRLQKLLQQYPNAVLAGHSLGAWWLSNLATRDVQINKLVLWTPLSDTNGFGFNVSNHYCPLIHSPNKNTGSHKVLVYWGTNDLIVPGYNHGRALMDHFSAMNYKLDGGHLYQKNHQAALNYMRDWIEI